MNGCSFTGHRIIPETQAASLEDLVLRAIAYAYAQGCRNFYTGGALGFDTLCAKQIIRFRMSHPDARFILILPCKDQAWKWNGRQIEMYEFTLSSADEIIYVSEEYTPTCMKKRNKSLVDNCDLLIAYVERERSGAGQTVAMARAAEKQVYNLFPYVKPKK